MENKGSFMKTFVFVMVFGLVLFGCNNVSTDDSLINIRVINETGRAITNVRFTGSDGSVIPVEEISRQAWGNQGQGHCWMRQGQDITYTLSWECPAGGPLYAQMGGGCQGGRNNAYRFSFNDGQQRTIVLRADDTWRFSN